jgi:imidazolonepropionase-like amidohydrolase
MADTLITAGRVLTGPGGKYIEDGAVLVRGSTIAAVGPREKLETRAAFDKFVNSLEFYEHLGISLDKIIDMATVDAAHALGIGSDTGRLAEGYRADILVVDGQPPRRTGRPPARAPRTGRRQSLPRLNRYERAQRYI